MFSGTVTGKHDAGLHTQYTFSVESRWKGASQSSIELYSGGLCGYQFTTGATYLVFARNNGEQLRSGLCSGTRRMDAAQAQLKQLPAPR